jgi:hypothetical protein
MGYRSDVAISFYTRNEREKNFPLLKLWFDENYPKLDFGEVEVGSDYINVWYTDVKWYDGYHDVDAVGRAVDKFRETFNTDEDNAFAYETIRVGEETSDIESDASPYHDYRLGVNRTIRFE